LVVQLHATILERELSMTLHDGFQLKPASAQARPYGYRQLQRIVPDPPPLVPVSVWLRRRDLTKLPDAFAPARSFLRQPAQRLLRLVHPKPWLPLRQLLLSN